MSSWWLAPSWALWFDTHYNVDAFFLVRGGLTYAFDKGPSVTGGYAFLLLNPDFERHEHRAWGQVFIPWHLNDRWSLSERLRMDFRFLESLDGGRVTSGYDFVFRTRLQTALTRRFAPTRFGEPSLQLAHELLLNAAASPGRDVVDQNRVTLSVGLTLKHLTVRVGYMNRYFPNARGGDGRFEHAAILWFTQSIDLSSRKGLRKQDEYDDYPEYGGE